MRKALGAAREGQALSHLPRPDQNLWVKTADWDEWLERFGSAITLKPAARRLGVCSSTFSRLVSDGLFKPLASVPEMAPRYLPFDIDKLVAAVCIDAVVVQDMSKGRPPSGQRLQRRVQSAFFLQKLKFALCQAVFFGTKDMQCVVILHQGMVNDIDFVGDFFKHVMAFLNCDI
ncbi:MAG: hypothetical protein ACFB11_22005 [Paracoccaceae bacterium]